MDEGVEGCIHFESSCSKKVVSVGDVVQVKILSVDIERQRIALSMKDLK